MQDSIAIYYEDTEISYKDLILRSNKYAQWFLNTDLSKGDVVALMMDNRPEFLACWIGITQVGGTVALINTNLNSEALDYSLNISQAKNLILGQELLENFSSTQQEVKDNFSTWVQDGKQEPSYFKNLDEVLDNISDNKPAIDYVVSNSDSGLYIYTSGTTGNPKAATLSHKRLRLMMMGFKGAIRPNKNDKIYNV